jgi:hypothetical protein
MAEVRKCPSTLCALWRFRMGKEENDGLKPQRKNNKDYDNIDDSGIEDC